jgi:uncharacterized membrane protein
MRLLRSQAPPKQTGLIHTWCVTSRVANATRVLGLAPLLFGCLVIVVLPLTIIGFVTHEIWPLGLAFLLFLVVGVVEPLSDLARPRRSENRS